VGPNALLTDLRGFQRVLFLGSFVFLIARSPVWDMVWDANGYLNSSLQWFGGGVKDDEQLFYRGVLSSFVYLPPSFIGAKFLEPSVFGTYIYVLVMIQNAALASWISVYLLPKVSGLFTPPKHSTVVVTSVLGVYALHSFVSYSLMDLWAVAFLLSGCWLIYENKRGRFTVAGLALGVCFNLRPSYLITLVLILGFVLFDKKTKAVFVALGFILAQSPQVVYNWFEYRTLSIVPSGLAKLSGSNPLLGAASIRYDSIGYSKFASGGVSFCDQAMYELVVKSGATSRFELLKIYLFNLDEFAPFFLKKLAAAFWWPVDVPYYDHNPIVNSVFGAVILFIFVFGFGYTIWMVFRSMGWINQQSLVAVLVGAGFLANLFLYHSETRYGLPLVLLGIVGLALFSSEILALDSFEHFFWRAHKRYVLSCSVVYAVLFFFAASNVMGSAGMANLGLCT
jgi:hypothetical protein